MDRLRLLLGERPDVLRRVVRHPLPLPSRHLARTHLPRGVHRPRVVRLLHSPRREARASPSPALLAQERVRARDPVRCHSLLHYTQY